MIGTRLGQYRLDRLLGRGGMGAVYQATDEMIGRQVAIKVLRTDVTGSPDAEERFRTEARILASLDHPHILRLHGFSRDEDVLYMVTEFVQGETLQHMLESGTPIDTNEALRWIDEVLDALQYAHHLGVVHRDLKPANVLIDTRGRARLLDFGIAKVAGQDGLTRTGHAVGTLLYMAPEQVMDEPIDGRTDLYAFAVLACELLAGRRPYRSSTTAGLLREIVDGPPPDVAALLPPAAAPAAAPLLRALARRAADRPPTAASLRDDLRTAFETAAPAAAPSSPAGAPATPLTPPPLPTLPATLTQSRTQHGIELPRQSPRRTWPALAALGAMAVVGLALVWAFFLRPRPVPPVDGAITTSVTGTPADTTMPPLPGTSPNVVAPPEAIVLPPATTTAPGPMAMARRPDPTAAATTTSTSVTPDAPATAPVVTTPAPPVETTALPPAVAPAAPAAPASFGGIVYIERIDDEDEEFDVSVRLDGKAVVVVDEDDEVKKTVPYSAITQATYYTRGPARFALRRSPSHWIRLEGSSPVVLRMSARAVDQVLSALDAHGVKVTRNR
ncbi:MAG TPA: protein kinase [Luteitalea sp.]|nr:protein kinase [Luteitalea sp.]